MSEPEIKNGIFPKVALSSSLYLISAIIQLFLIIIPS